MALESARCGQLWVNARITVIVWARVIVGVRFNVTVRVMLEPALGRV